MNVKPNLSQRKLLPITEPRPNEPVPQAPPNSPNALGLQIQPDPWSSGQMTFQGSASAPHPVASASSFVQPTQSMQPWVHPASAHNGISGGISTSGHANLASTSQWAHPKGQHLGTLAGQKRGYTEAAEKTHVDPQDEQQREKKRRC